MESYHSFVIKETGAAILREGHMLCALTTECRYKNAKKMECQEYLEFLVEQASKKYGAGNTENEPLLLKLSAPMSYHYM